MDNWIQKNWGFLAVGAVIAFFTWSAIYSTDCVAEASQYDCTSEASYYGR